MRALNAAARTLDALGDRPNALYARLVGARRQLLVGELQAAEQTLAAVDVDAAGAPPPLAARAELTRAELALRRVRVADAAAALGRAHAAALAAGIPALVAEIGRARHTLSAPSARLIRGGVVRPVRLDEVEALFASGDLVVDACRRAVRGPARSVPLAGRPVLFALVGALAEAWPADVPRDRLVERAFETRVANDSFRARLRVELGRLRAALRPLVRIEATRRGFALVPVGGRAVVVLAPPIDGPADAIIALLEGGESSSFGSDFNVDFGVGFTEEQQRRGAIEYNYERGGHAMDMTAVPEPVAKNAAMAGTDVATYTRERPGLSAFARENGIVYHAYSTYARGLDGLWGMYQWLDRAPNGRNETGVWWRRHDEYNRADEIGSSRTA